MSDMHIGEPVNALLTLEPLGVVEIDSNYVHHIHEVRVDGQLVWIRSRTVPTRADVGKWWWRDDVTYPVRVNGGAKSPLNWFRKERLRGLGKNVPIEDDGHWICECIKPVRGT